MDRFYNADSNPEDTIPKVGDTNKICGGTGNIMDLTIICSKCGLKMYPQIKFLYRDDSRIYRYVCRNCNQISEYA